MSFVLLENISLEKYHTFHLPVKARYFFRVQHLADLRAISQLPLPHFILGGGSNILPLQDFPGTIIKNELLGMNVQDFTQDEVLFSMASGEKWQTMVDNALENNWSGIENLSSIPGTVGAAPVQNIGAYGVELKDVFHSLQAFDLQTQTFRTFSLSDCAFDYRNSVFKQTTNRYFITEVTLRLRKKNHQLHYAYAPLQAFFQTHPIEHITAKAIAQAVDFVRKGKLPDPNFIGNAGSFFKNPIITTEHLAQLQKKYPQIPFYPQNTATVKVPAAWLIETLGWKGKTIQGRYGVHAQQPLVLVHYHGATGQEIAALAAEIIADVQQNFQIQLIPEVYFL